jgi:hypothetical protein
MNAPVMEWIIGGGGLLALFAMLFKHTKEVNAKISRVYGRLDEVKDDTEGKYTRKDMCSTLHKQLRDDIQDIKSDVKELLRRNGGD